VLLQRSKSAATRGFVKHPAAVCGSIIVDLHGLAGVEGIEPIIPEAAGDLGLGGGVFDDLVVDPFRDEVEEAKHGGISFLSRGCSRRERMSGGLVPPRRRQPS